MISITGLDQGFGVRRLFRGAELRIGARDRLALVGPNGSGKTTLFEMIVGLQDPDAGSSRSPAARGSATFPRPPTPFAVGRSSRRCSLQRRRIAPLEAEWDALTE